MDAIELEIRVMPCTRPESSFALKVDVGESTTTSDILYIVKGFLNIDNSRSTTWSLYEKWMDIERRLPNKRLLPILNEWEEDVFSDVQYIARESMVHRPNRKLARSHRRKLNDIMLLSNELFNSQYQTRQLRVMQIKRNMIQSSSDPTQKGLMAMSSLNNKVKKLKASNEKLSAEVSEMNHEAIKLSEHLSALRKESEHVVDLLTHMKAESTVKRDMESREKCENLSLLNTSIHHIQRELDKKQRITELQDQKLKKAQKDVTRLKAILQQKETELKQLKEWSKEKKQVTLPDKSRCLPNFSQVSYGSTSGSQVFIGEVQNDETFGGDSLASFESNSSLGSGFSRKASGSIRRRFADFEERTKQILEAEGKTFREAKPRKVDSTAVEVQNFKRSISSPDANEIGLVASNIIPQVTEQLSPYSTEIFHSLQRSKAAKKVPSIAASNSLTNLDNRTEPSVPLKSILNTKEPKVIRSPENRVKFTPESILLNAAWEGELDVLKDCIQKLGTYKVVSGLGATCLHNAVCSGNLEVIDYLIQQMYDVNAQDCQGWTPLHCAAAYCIFSAIQLLIKNGASLFMTNIDNMTATDIAKEEMEGTHSEEAKLCYTYLMEYHKNLGIMNNATVFALFSYTPETNWDHHHNLNEMPVIKGEKFTVTNRNEDGWWELMDNRGIKGLVPSSYLGLYPPYLK